MFFRVTYGLCYCQSFVNRIIMKVRTFFLANLLLFSLVLKAHQVDEAVPVLKHWFLKNQRTELIGSFSFIKDNQVFIEDEKGTMVHIPFSDLNESDRIYVMDRENRIEKLNQNLAPISFNQQSSTSYNYKFWFLISIVFVMAMYLLLIKKQEKKLAFTAFSVMMLFLLYSFTDDKVMRQLRSTTNPTFIDSAFAQFKPKIYTHWDATYFYVESKGIPDHGMMTGITSWQQQVPIPQCYTTANNNNHWSIPLNPVIATTPVPVNQNHFLRGAVALAVNGIPIFNPYTNTGIDALLDGQLDNWGGHCGRADDYHYHVAPLHLYGEVPLTKPIAFALDGFAVYGSKEPDGSNMTTLDANHGHYGTNGVYHYHGTATAPYMIGNMVGQVTEDATLQIIPQAAAKPVRPFLNPLTGATITNCVPNANNNGYNLTYTRSGQTYQVNYYWGDTTNSKSKYIFRFVSPSGSYADSIYVAASQSLCIVPTSSTPPTTAGINKTMKRLPDTGENLGYTSTYGEDNDFTLFPSYFSNAGNGITIDSVTGLMWQKVDGGEMTYENAIIYADTLTLGGYTNWRLPSPRESFSIINLQNVNPAIDQTVFTPTGGNAEYWWTNARQANDTTKVWCTNSGGGIGNKPKTETISAGGTKRYHVRAVRDVQTPATVSVHFVNNGNGTITDSITNLMWQRIPHSDSLTWENALTYADTLSVGGYIDWRLPNVKELQSICEETRYTPGIDTAFFKITNNKKYWSSTSIPNRTTQAWYLNTQYGITSYDEKIRRDLVLCVRGSSNISSNYTFTGNGDWDKVSNWAFYTIPPKILPTGYAIMIDPVSGGQCNLNVTQTINQGASISVQNGKVLMIPGSLIQQ